MNLFSGWGVYIRYVHLVTYLGGSYTGRGGVLRGFYGILFFAIFDSEVLGSLVTILVVFKVCVGHVFTILLF